MYTAQLQARAHAELTVSECVPQLSGLSRLTHVIIIIPVQFLVKVSWVPIYIDVDLVSVGLSSSMSGLIELMN